jgi:hypothetical protein
MHSLPGPVGDWYFGYLLWCMEAAEWLRLRLR